MENAVDALKIAFAVFVFVIALTLAFSVVGQARATSDTVLALNDKTSLYDYVDESESNANTKDRIVGFETILPTIYRYAKEQYAVTIVDKDGNVVVRYDLYTEGFMNEWNTIIKKMNNSSQRGQVENTFKEIEDRIAIVDDMIQKEIGKSNVIWSGLVIGSSPPYNYGNLYKVKNTNNPTVTVGAPWGSDYTEIKKRIDADIIKNGKYTNNGVEYTGKNLNQFKDKKFKEKFIEIQTSGTTITEQDEETNIEYSLETVRGNKKLEIVYIEQQPK